MHGAQGKHFFRAATVLAGANMQENQKKVTFKQKQVRFQHMIAAMNTPAVLQNGQPNPAAKAPPRPALSVCLSISLCFLYPPSTEPCGLSIPCCLSVGADSLRGVLDDDRGHAGPDPRVVGAALAVAQE